MNAFADFFGESGDQIIHLWFRQQNFKLHPLPTSAHLFGNRETALFTVTVYRVGGKAAYLFP